jgi:glutamate N-acetyltransferase/amino-acid N-acetyltransferase
MGQSGVEFSPDKVDISIDSEKGSLFIAKAGLACDYDEDYATLVLSPKEVRLTANLNIGDERASAWGCDLTYDYIRINADYRK